MSPIATMLRCHSLLRWKERYHASCLDLVSFHRRGPVQHPQHFTTTVTSFAEHGASVAARGLQAGENVASSQRPVG